MGLSLQDMERLAELARLDLDEKEKAIRSQELERVLEYVNRLAAIDTTGVAEASSLAKGVARGDSAFPCDELARELILSNFPDRAGDALRVPAVFDRPKG